MKSVITDRDISLVPDNHILSFIRIKRIEAKDIPKGCMSMIKSDNIARSLEKILGSLNPTECIPNDTQELYLVRCAGSDSPKGEVQLPELKFFEIATIVQPCKGCPGINCKNCNITAWFRGF